MSRARAACVACLCGLLAASGGVRLLMGAGASPDPVAAAVSSASSATCGASYWGSMAAAAHADAMVLSGTWAPAQGVRWGQRNAHADPCWSTAQRARYAAAVREVRRDSLSAALLP